MLLYPNRIFWSLLCIPVMEQWYLWPLPPFRNIEQSFGKVNCEWTTMSAPRLVFDLLLGPSLKLYKRVPHLCGSHWMFLVYNELWHHFFLVLMQNFISCLNYRINWEMSKLLEMSHFVADISPNGIFISSQSQLNAWVKNNRKSWKTV